MPQQEADARLPVQKLGKFNLPVQRMEATEKIARRPRCTLHFNLSLVANIGRALAKVV